MNQPRLGIPLERGFLPGLNAGGNLSRPRCGYSGFRLAACHQFVVFVLCHV